MNCLESISTAIREFYGKNIQDIALAIETKDSELLESSLYNVILHYPFKTISSRPNEISFALNELKGLSKDSYTHLYSLARSRDLID